MLLFPQVTDDAILASINCYVAQPVTEAEAGADALHCFQSIQVQLFLPDEDTTDEILFANRSLSTEAMKQEAQQNRSCSQGHICSPSQEELAAAAAAAEEVPAPVPINPADDNRDAPVLPALLPILPSVDEESMSEED